MFPHGCGVGDILKGRNLFLHFKMSKHLRREQMEQIRKLRKELIISIISVIVAAVALSSSTYAWYVANNTVKAKTSTITATTNGFILQITTSDKGGVQHGGSQESLTAFSKGEVLSPASTDDILDNWYVCKSWNGRGNVVSYYTPDFSTGTKPGNYKENNQDYFAYIKSDYILYTITETGTADVYLDASDGAPIVVTADTGTGVSTVINSMRVAITTQKLDADGKTAIGPETLRVVYSPQNETGIGNDEAGLDGWSCISNVDGVNKPIAASYPHIYAGNYVDQNNKNWAITKQRDSEYYTVPDNSIPIKEKVGYDGVAVHVYIWMEGTDADCVNGKSIENDDSQYSVTVKFAGVASGN